MRTCAKSKQKILRHATSYLLSKLLTTPDLHITTNIITVDLWEPAVMYLHCRLWAWKWENDWGWAKTGSEAPHHYRFVAWTGSVFAATYHCRFKPQTGSDLALSLSVNSEESTVISLQLKKAAAVLFFLLSSIPRIEARVWALPSIVAAVLHHEASAWILKNGLIFLL